MPHFVLFGSHHNFWNSANCSHIPLFPYSFVPIFLCSHIPLFPYSFVPIFLCSHIPNIWHGCRTTITESVEIFTFLKTINEVLKVLVRSQILTWIKWPKINFRQKIIRKVKSCIFLGGEFISEANIL